MEWIQRKVEKEEEASLNDRMSKEANILAEKK